jgi:hypothetical protein
MKKWISLLAFALVFAAATVAQASELDNEDAVKNAQRLAKNLPQTLVVRKDAMGNVSVLHSKDLLQEGASIDESKFIDLKDADGRRELDGDSSSSGWYFYWNYNYNYYYPTYYYGNYYYYYQQYYSYSYNNNWYYWYRWY